MKRHNRSPFQKASRSPETAQRPELRVLMPDAPKGFPQAHLYHPAQADDAAPFLCAHRGASMNPTLCDRDFLEVTPYQDRRIRIGDVIAFAPPDGGELIAHRVVAVSDGKARTRGDNNGSDDSNWLGPEHILGQVTGAWRGARHRSIAGGWAGRVRAWAVRWRKRLDRWFSPLLHPLYAALAWSGLLRRLYPKHLAPRVVVFQVDGNPSARLLVGRRTIGHYHPGRQRWEIRRPYKLIVDGAMLPHPALSQPQSSRAAAAPRSTPDL